eukprot:TRINITY_DN9937_c0_g1_i8.p1 TRINITY_DN9937_c0_g1~~TRINITY_DN9937_c0_g1_i8.p1  ORF type:complete len:299 (+),score=52.45 TRINITY_DN9937_c0_g1_i8:46-897(+)
MAEGQADRPRCRRCRRAAAATLSLGLASAFGPLRLRQSSFAGGAANSRSAVAAASSPAAVRGLVDFWKRPDAELQEPYLDIAGIRYVKPYRFESFDRLGAEVEGLPAAAALAATIGDKFDQDEGFWQRELGAGNLAVRGSGGSKAGEADGGCDGYRRLEGGAGCRLRTGDVLRWRRRVLETPTLATPPPAELFRGEGVLALQKPPTLRTHGQFAMHNSLHAWAVRACRGGFACPVHRLDQVVGGVLLCATTKAVYRRLKLDFQSRPARRRWSRRPCASKVHLA